jgi:alpha/beta superfamily hydrolase
MKIDRNIVIDGDNDKPIVLDFGYKISNTKKPVVIFAHGFKGFKDWGHFNMVMDHFIKNDFAFLKFNFSHNGGTVKDPIDFPDLEAFGNNNYSKELADLKTVLDWIENNDNVEIDSQQIYLIGHSRGGGISILGSKEDARIKKLVTWAAVSDLINRYSEQQMAHWKKEGVLLINNTRTNQEMPLYYQLVEDVLNDTNRFDIEQVAKQVTIPHLVIHGTNDDVVHLDEAKKINSWVKTSDIHIIEGADHSFGGKHPFEDEELPKDVQELLEKTLAFLKK